MKRLALLTSLAAFLLVLNSCGSGNKQDPNAPSPGSQLPHRVLLANRYGGIIQVIDAEEDLQTRFNVQVGGNPDYLQLSPDKSHTVYIDTSSTTPALGVIQNSNETQANRVTLPDWSDSAVVINSGLLAYAAIPNQLVTENNVSFRGALNVVDFTASTVTPVPFEGVRTVVLDHGGKKVLGLSPTTNTVRLYDVTAKTLGAAITGFDRPGYAVFSSDDSKAYILNCGGECGGTTASVTELTIASGATRSVSVSGATVALLNGNQLWVAGGAGGFLEQIDVSTMTASTNGFPVAIGPGSHRSIALAGSKLFIGATGCGTSGCLSIVDTGSKNVIIDNPAAGADTKGDVTGIAPLPFRNIVYVTEGGELRIYDQATGNEIPGKNGNVIDVFGDAASLVALDD